MSSKKAVSPLIATVLLVMIVVSIGAAVMVVIQGLSEEQISNIQYQQEAIKCGTEVALKVVDVNNVNRMCYNTTAFAIQLQNSGQKDIEKWNLLVVGDTTMFLEDKGGEFVAGNVTTLKFDWASSVSNIAKIQVIPKISNGNNYIPCTLPILEFDGDELTAAEGCEDTTVSWENTIVAFT
jgi:flagellin-like protein